MPEDEIQSHTFKGQLEGPHMLIFGAIHGNEPCGPKSIERLVHEITKGSILLLKGQLTLIPVCNPRAYAQNLRQIDENLNRIFKRTDTPQSYESGLARTLTNYVDTADILLDIHSTSAAGPTSVFIDYPTDKNISLATALRADYALHNWPELYASNQNTFESYDTIRYANKTGKSGVLVECGQHEEVSSVDFAYKSILRALRHLGMIAETAQEPETLTVHITMQALYGKEDTDDAFTKKWNHLDAIPKGTLIATRSSGSTICADTDVMMLLPKHHAQKGEEWFYLGKVINA